MVLKSDFDADERDCNRNFNNSCACLLNNVASFSYVKILLSLIDPGQ